MHELALVDDLISLVADETASRGEHVEIVRLRIGPDACVSKDALLFCFEVCTPNTPLEGAALEILDGEGAELRLQDLEVSE